MIAVYGNTNAGKSTLGMGLERIVDCKYLAFGDLKRREVHSSTPLGIRIKSQVENRHPIDPKDGASLLSANLSNRLNVVSGFPISTQELANLGKGLVVGLIDIKVKTETAMSRFFTRGICRICGLPGKKNDVCPVHNIPLLPRNDVSLVEFERRLELYEKRVRPFLCEPSIAKFPRITLDSDNMSALDMLTETVKWLEKFNLASCIRSKT